jgi:hypothetical protein
VQPNSENEQAASVAARSHACVWAVRQVAQMTCPASHCRHHMQETQKAIKIIESLIPSDQRGRKKREIFEIILTEVRKNEVTLNVGGLTGQ